MVEDRESVISAPIGSAIPGNRWDLLDGVSADPPPVSVIVAHYSQPAQLARTLHGLRRQDFPADRLEVIVADDGSPQRPHIPQGVRLVRQEDAGFRLAAVRNLGAAAATGEILVFLDADTTPEPSFVRELVRLPALAPDCVTVGRRRHARLDGLPATAPVEQAVAGRELADPRWLTDAYRATQNLLQADDRSYRYVIGAVLACSRRMMEEVGGFDESFTTYGGEDWEWGYRAWIRGALLAHVPSAVAWHDGPDAGSRPTSARAGKSAEAIRLSDLIPLPGSRGRGLRSTKVDIAVTGPPAPATEAQIFVSVDSVLAVLPGAEATSRSDRPLGDSRDRFDRVRIRVEILRPLVVLGDCLGAQVARIGAEQLGQVTILDQGGAELIRIVATRAEARNARWSRDDLFPRERTACADMRVIGEDVDVEGYLGGWS